MKYSPKCKIWLEREGEKLFGDGPCDMLELVERTGSLRMAAAEMRMSYSQAWQLINRLEKKLGFPLMIRKAGGQTGGGSVLTRQGAELTKKFSRYRREVRALQNDLFLKYFNPSD
jgi:molybdate transport system regulatory protein